MGFLVMHLLLFNVQIHQDANCAAPFVLTRHATNAWMAISSKVAHALDVRRIAFSARALLPVILAVQDFIVMLPGNAKLVCLHAISAPIQHPASTAVTDSFSVAILVSNAVLLTAEVAMTQTYAVTALIR
jgi:hypothetical protein